MRRALSILLMLLFGAGPLSFAFTASEDATLPACCRRLGAHHCAMDDQQSPRPAGAVLKAPSRCSQYPQRTTARTSTFAAVFPRSGALFQIAWCLNCSGSYAGVFTNIYLRTTVLRGPPATLPRLTTH